jgi:hypothetical protein
MITMFYLSYTPYFQKKLQSETQYKQKAISEEPEEFNITSMCCVIHPLFAVFFI